MFFCKIQLKSKFEIRFFFIITYNNTTLLLDALLYIYACSAQKFTMHNCNQPATTAGNGIIINDST